MPNYSLLTYLTLGLYPNAGLVYTLAVRDIQARYRGSALGILWALLVPLAMLVIYTFVFSVVFKARWPALEGQEQAGYALVLFAGLIAHGLLAETLSQAPTLVSSQANLVKKVVFPLQALAWVPLISGLFHFAISLLVLLAVQWWLDVPFQLSILLLPIVLLPLVFLCLGVCWFLSALGVFFRDISHVVTLAVTALLFGSGVFFPISTLPSAIQSWLWLNPLAVVIEQLRGVVLFGVLPDWSVWGLTTFICWIFSLLSLRWFAATRKGFADVL